MAVVSLLTTVLLVRDVITGGENLAFSFQIAWSSRFLLPAALLLSIFLPQAITPLLMLGGLYLAYEGFEKVLHMVTGHSETHSVISPQEPVDPGFQGAFMTELAQRVHPTDLELAALISSKICHDVIGPVGAIYNGLGAQSGRVPVG